jgi:FkbM family methyltransferase
MVDASYKLNRIRRLAPVLGLGSALSLEAQITLKRPLMRVRHKEYPAPIYLRGASSDINVFEAVFEKQELTWTGSPVRGHIIDGGANAGLSTLYFAQKFPHATVIAVEPDAANVQMIARNTAHLSSVRIERAGLWSKDCDLVIANPDAEAWGLQCRPARPSESARAFRGLSMSSLFARHGVESWRPPITGISG